MAMTLDQIFSGQMSYNQRRALKALLEDLIENGSGGGGSEEDHQAILDLIARVDSLESGEVLDDETVDSIATRLAATENGLESAQAAIAALQELPGGVTSVNGDTGEVELTAADLDTLTEDQILALMDAVGGDQVKGMWSLNSSYEVGDVVGYEGGLYRALVDVPAAPTLSYVASSTESWTAAGLKQVPLPTGTQSGDLLLIVSNGRQLSDFSIAGATTLAVADPGGNYGYGRLDAFYKYVSSADVTAGVIAVTAGFSAQPSTNTSRSLVMRTYRNAGAPKKLWEVNSNAANTTLSVANPAHSLTVGAIGVEVFGFFSQSNNFTADNPSLTGNGVTVANAVTGRNALQSQTIAGDISTVTGTIGAGAVTATRGSAGVNASWANAGFEIPVGASGFVVGQWERLASAPPTLWSASKGYKAGAPVVYNGDLYTANADIPAPGGISYVGSSTGSNSAAFPAGTQAGDLVVAIVSLYSSYSITMSGWTDAGTSTGSEGKVQVFSKNVTASDLLASVTPASGYNNLVTLRTYRGASPVGALTKQDTINTGTGPTNFNFPAKTVAAGALLLLVASTGRNNVTFATEANIIGPGVASVTRATYGNAIGNTSTATAHVLEPGTTFPAAQAVGVSAQANSTYSSLMMLDIPVSATFNANQWTKILDVAGKAPSVTSLLAVNYTIQPTDSFVIYRQLNSNLTLTLPSIATWPAGKPLTIADGNGQSPTYPFTIARAGSDTIETSGGYSITMNVAYGAITLIPEPNFNRWKIVSDTRKLDSAAGAVGLTNLADAAKTALALDSAGVNSGSAIAAKTTQVIVDLPANGTVTLPSVSGHGTGRLLFICSRNPSGTGAPAAFALTVNRAGSDTIGRSGATSLVLPADTGFTLLRSTGEGRWDIIAGAGAPDSATVTALAARKPGPNPRGAYDIATTYAAGDTVTHADGRTYLAIRDIPPNDLQPGVTPGAPPSTPLIFGSVAPSAYYSNGLTSWNGARAWRLDTLTAGTLTRNPGSGSPEIGLVAANGTSNVSNPMAASVALAANTTYYVYFNAGGPASSTLNYTGTLASPSQGWAPLTPAPPTRATATKATASLATDASESGTVDLAKSFRLLKVATDRPARVRLYATAAQRDADASRPAATPIDATTDHGCLLEFISTTGSLARVLTPQVDGSSMESTPTSALPYSITNLDASSAVVTTTFTYIATEV